MSSLIRALINAERAEQMALRLRREHGLRAEEICDQECRRGHHGRFWADVRRSLKWVRTATPEDA